LPLWKRTLDFVLIFFLLPGILLASAVAVMIIKLTSRGPVLFTQERVGYRGRRFRIFKFRTMHSGADTRSHEDHVKQLIASGKPMAKLDGKRDPRLIPLGAVLRATGIDELPQILNIIKGDMSFVGPRPCVPYEYEQYEPRHRARLNSVPGLTGLWQVNGKNKTTFERMVELDVEYGNRCSLGMDLSIIMRTFGALAGQCKELRQRKQNTESAPVLSAARN
jgi:lipopolysaccharide/colanic/teichoic acid biosynthesis glycosyltransferase